MKNFADLSRLRDALKAEEQARALARERERVEQARRAREAAVFQQAMVDAVPLPRTDRASPARPATPPQPRQRELDEQQALAQSMSDEIDIERLLDTDEALSYRREGVGSDVVTRLRRGHWTVQGQIDLHGMRVEEAREALGQFLVDAIKRHRRCLRVIHGKGLGSIAREPVLKGKVLRWLVQRDDVLAFCQARPNDGGAGALLVLLRGA
ncbi:MAG: Smr/MutS family protein [Burkholderiales bacterium]|nr:Smr/MutS family protein [Burkholderiales bacterium]